MGPGAKIIDQRRDDFLAIDKEGLSLRNSGVPARCDTPPQVHAFSV